VLTNLVDFEGIKDRFWISTGIIAARPARSGSKIVGCKFYDLILLRVLRTSVRSTAQHVGFKLENTSFHQSCRPNDGTEMLFLVLLAPLLDFTMSNADAPDDFFLNFGSSSNVCDQLRHSIRQEVTEIDASIIKIEEDSRKEDRTSQEMAKSIVHARKEMYNLRRFAHDMVDSTNMNEALRVRMMEDLQAELVRPYLLKREGENSCVEKVTEDEHGDGHSSPICVSFLKDRQAEIQLFLASRSKSSADAIAIFERKRELEDAKVAIERLMVTENLEEKVKLAQMEVAELSNVLENEQRRLRISKEAVHEARTKSGKHAQEIANYVSNSTTN
jgi:hypothetical protein